MNQQLTGSNRSGTGYFTRVQRRLLTEATKSLFRRPIAANTAVPLVSFTFDDFPRSAFLEAAPILRRHEAFATYYVSMGLMGTQSHLGPMFHAEDLEELADQGHELGCHTFGHCHSWNTPPDVYEKAILQNQQAFNSVLPGVSFQTFAYPHSAPQPAVKCVARRHFLCCRGGGLSPGPYLRHAAGGQTFNSGTTDLNFLCAFFLEKARHDPEAVKCLIHQNACARGWLIFATHDVCPSPSPYGCTPGFFEQVVRWTTESGARILPIVAALNVLRAAQPKGERPHEQDARARFRLNYRH